MARSSSKTFRSVSSSSVWPGFLTAVVTALIGWGLAALGLWAAGGLGGSVVTTLQTTSHIWLVAHGTGLEAGGIAITLVPWGAVVVAVAIHVVVAARVLDGPVDEPAAFVATAAGTYGVLGAAVAASSSTGSVSVSMVRAAFILFLVAAAGTVCGYVRSHGAPSAWWPEDDALRAVVRGAAMACGVVLTLALVLVLVLFAFRIDRAGDLWALLDPGLGAGLALGVACVLFVPTLTLWAAAALMGPGFQVGTDTTIDLTGSHLGEVPGFPILAALPPPGDFPGWTFLLGLAPALGGALAGWWMVRRGHADTGTDFWRGLGVVATAGGAGGVLLAVLVWLSGGAVGPGRMSEVGPGGWSGLLVTVPVMAVGAGVGAVLAHYRGGRAHAS